jgi:hypothetical protein
MTLSRFLRDYIYIPLGGNKKGYRVEYGALLLTFFLGGVWHGAGLTFVIWGILHGAALVLERILGLTKGKSLKWIRRLATLLFVNFAWVFFRSPNLDTAVTIIQRMLTPGYKSAETNQRVIAELAWWPSGVGDLPIELWARLPILFLILILVLVVIYAPNSFEVSEKAKSSLLYFSIIALATFSFLFGLSLDQQIFLYFNF